MIRWIECDPAGFGKVHHQRIPVESACSSIKERFGAVVAAKTLTPVGASAYHEQHLLQPDIMRLQEEQRGGARVVLLPADAMPRGMKTAQRRNVVNLAVATLLETRFWVPKLAKDSAEEGQIRKTWTTPA